MNKRQRELKTWMLENSMHTHQEGDSGVKPVVCHGDGTVSVRSTFFYKHGRSAESHGQDLLDDLTKPGAPEGWELVRVRENYRRWPDESYFEATLGQVEEGEVA